MPSTYQAKVIDAPVERVWQAFRDFHDLSWAPNVITGVAKVGDLDGSTPGARRVLNQAFHETLVEIDHQAHRLKYSIDDGPSPVSKDEVRDYFGAVELSPAEDGARTLVEWSSSWEADFDDAVAFCHGIYVALLNELAAKYNKAP